jgi:ABC-type glycerol-3-phosphate transport system substrate-binding protein
VLALTSLAACGTSSSDDNSGSGGGSKADISAPLDPKTKVTLTIDCMPPAAKAAELREWKEDVREFNKKYPNVTISGKSTPGQCEEPARFTAQLKAKSQPDVFYTYFTDLQQVLDNNGAADITAYVTPRTVPALDSIDGNVLGVLKKDGKLYGLPTSNYTMGLLINRKLFERAGLDPDKPPTTWEEVRTAAKKIAGLGNGISGYGEYSAENTGGWHFTAAMYGLGADVVSADGKKAAFNDATGKQVAQQLHDMRWKDDSMGKTQLLKWGDLQKQIASDKLGMFLAAPDDITYMVQQLGAEYENFGMGPLPGGRTTLFGGNDYMIKKGSSRSRRLSPGSTSRPSPRARASSSGTAPRRTSSPSACRSRTSSPVTPRPRTSRPVRRTRRCPSRTSSRSWLTLCQARPSRRRRRRSTRSSTT